MYDHYTLTYLARVRVQEAQEFAARARLAVRLRQARRPRPRCLSAALIWALCYPLKTRPAATRVIRVVRAYTTDNLERGHIMERD
jgi:hypothetical protein